MLLLRLKLVLARVLCNFHLSASISNKVITLKVRQAARYSASSVFPLCAASVLPAVLHCKASVSNPGGSGDRSQKLENKIERTSQATLLCWVYLFHTVKVKNSRSKWFELSASCYRVLLHLCSQKFLKEEAVLPAPALCCPGLHTRPARSSDIAPTYFLLPHPFLKNIYTSLLHTHMVRKKESLNNSFCNGQNSIYLQQMLAVWNKILPL